MFVNVNDNEVLLERGLSWGCSSAHVLLRLLILRFVRSGGGKSYLVDSTTWFVMLSTTYVFLSMRKVSTAK